MAYPIQSPLRNMRCKSLILLAHLLQGMSIGLRHFLTEPWVLYDLGNGDALLGINYKYFVQQVFAAL